MKYPKEHKFKSSGFDWTLKFLDIHDVERSGLTVYDQKEVLVYTKNHSHQHVTETLIHELIHVLMYDATDAIFQFDAETNHKKEENAIILLSPRLFALLRDNPKLLKLITEMIGAC
jgi:hypothetical protein